jgi:hypothetical protein
VSLDEVVKVLSQYGLGAIFAGIIGWVLYKVGLRMIAAIDRLIEKIDELIKRVDNKIDEHTRVDIEHHAEVREELVGMRSRIDTALELAPVDSPRRSTPPRGVQSGYYAPARPSTKGGR